MDSDVQTYVTSHSHDEGYAGRIEVVTGPSGRRRWPEHVKAAMVLETYRDGVSVADVARRHDVSAPQLHAWRRAAREGLLPMPDDDALGLVPVVVSGGDNDDRMGSVPCDPAFELEIEGVRVRVPTGFDSDDLGRVIAAIRAVS
ncbi:transposase [Rhodovulum bhavnagarense]|uniref:Transposase n=1 Tax=Rhodovulum bhavnagarense TaxID=992286 RepID=A0A4R2R8K0_9RHOB|nr:transposase [Rhodovulum bhavnagarense]TCP58338.1 transposase [Rhodovulum bhavnagarense]